MVFPQVIAAFHALFDAIGLPVAVSYERYCAIVKSPLTHRGTITKSSVALIVLIWVIPIPLSIGPFLGFAGKYYYNPELFFCEQGWTAQSGSSARNVLVSSIASFLIPFLVIVFLNWSVYKTAKIQIEALQVQIGSLAGSDDQQQALTRRMRDRKAAVDITIIITAFLLCFLPSYIVGLLRHFVKSTSVPAEVILLTSSIFIVSSLCNPIIYSIRKRDFRAGVRNVLRRFGLCTCGNSNKVIAMNDLGFRATLATEAITSTPIAAFGIQDQHGQLHAQESTGRTRLNFQNRLSPISELIEKDG
ncbi:hypothetical protein ACROYT_G003676 [Oculina patagonica]